MTRLTQITDQEANPAAAALFDGVRSKIGMVPNVYRVTANQPAALAGLLILNEELGKGSFNAKSREAIALSVAGASNCDYCASAHTAISKGLKVDDTEIARRLKGKSADPKMSAILAFAVAVVDKRGFTTDEDVRAAREAGLTDSDIVETIANVVANIFTNYINHIAQTEIDFPVVEAQAA